MQVLFEWGYKVPYFCFSLLFLCGSCFINLHQKINVVMEWFSLEGTFEVAVATGRALLFLPSMFFLRHPFEACWSLWHSLHRVWEVPLRNCFQCLVGSWKGTNTPFFLSSSSLDWDLAALGTRSSSESCSLVLRIVVQFFLCKMFLILQDLWRAPGISVQGVMGQ